MEIEKLSTKKEKAFTKFDKLILQYLNHIKDNVNEIELPTAPEITYVYKAVKITKKSVQKQSHKKQALVLRKNYITLFKYYKEKTGIYTKYLKELKELKDKRTDVKPKIAKVKKKEEKKIEKLVTQVTPTEDTSKAEDKEVAKIDKKDAKKLEEVVNQATAIEDTGKGEDKEVSKVEIKEEKKSEEVVNQIAVMEETSTNNELMNKVDNITSKIESTKEVVNKEKPKVVDTPNPQNIIDPTDSFLSSFINAREKGVSEFQFNKKKISVVTRKEYIEKMNSARIYGKDSFTISGKTYSSKLKYEKIEKIKN